MAKAKIPITTPPASLNPLKRATGPALTKEKFLLRVRMRELDREFARQTKQLTALTKKFGKKLTEPITFGSKKPKS